MKNLLIFILLAFSISLFGQTTQPTPTKNKCASSFDSTLQREIYTMVDVAPEYPGGIPAFLSFFRKNFVYPKDQEVFQGTIYLSYIVEADGKMTNIRSSNKTLTAVDKEAIRVFQLMSPWTPAQCEGKNVAVQTRLPIKF